MGIIIERMLHFIRQYLLVAMPLQCRDISQSSRTAGLLAGAGKFFVVLCKCSTGSGKETFCPTDFVSTAPKTPQQGG